MLGEFIEFDSVADEYKPLKCFTEIQEDMGWDDVIANVEKRYAMSRPSIPDGRLPKHPDVDPTIMSIVGDMSRSPSIHDTPLWRVRCKV